MTGIVSQKTVSTDARTGTSVVVVDNPPEGETSLEAKAFERELNKFAAWCDAEKRPVFKQRNVRGDAAQYRYQTTNCFKSSRDGEPILRLHVVRLQLPDEEKPSAFLMDGPEFEKLFVRADD